MAVERTCVQCDDCDNYLETGLIPFKAKINKAKQAGWLVKMIRKGVFKHYCPSCKEIFKPGKPKPQPAEGEYWWQKY